MLLTQAGVVSALLARGLLDAAAIIDGDLVVADGSRRNINFEVLRERGRSYFVKQGVGDDRRRTVAHEAAMYEVLASSPTLEPLAPRRHLWDAEDCTLVVELGVARKARPRFIADGAAFLSTWAARSAAPSERCTARRARTRCAAASATTPRRSSNCTADAVRVCVDELRHARDRQDGAAIGQSRAVAGAGAA
jgi:hypothetical protein